MFKWIFGKKEKDEHKELIRLLKKGININVNISGTIDVKQEGRDSLEKESREINIQTQEKQIKERNTPTTPSDVIPNFSKLSGPEVKFGEEEET